MRRIIFLSLGFGALALGGVGLALPVLPTTPFVLCAAGCFGASSPRLARWLEHTPYFGEYVRNYRHKTGIRRRARVAGIGFLWAMLILSSLLAGRPLVTAALALVGVAVSIHILAIRPQRAPGQAPHNAP
ncbi:MAG: DUF454 domain-containing protein [Ruminococcaceae bacterium]|nr:DUF454 domain-containing protein [Oscillospiraceae bacterium]